MTKRAKKVRDSEWMRKQILNLWFCTNIIFFLKILSKKLLTKSVKIKIRRCYTPFWKWEIMTNQKKIIFFEKNIFLNLF